MYSFDQVETSLNTEALSSALFKMERFAILGGFSELAEWCGNELRGYPEGEIKDEKVIRKYREVAVSWLDPLGRPLIVDQTLAFISLFPAWQGVIDLETCETTGMARRYDELQAVLSRATGVAIGGLLIPAEQVKAVLRRIRFEALTRLHATTLVQSQKGLATQASTAMRLPSEAAPTCFLSYSWDGEGHQSWVRDLAIRLRQDGVNVKLDRWHAVPGDQLPQFMETAIRDNDFVLIVCTPKYRAKSDGRSGGVGYEGDIMTAEVFSSSNHRKFIPLLREGDWLEAIPSWLRGKVGIDLRGTPYSETNYDHLLRTLHGMVEVAPPVGGVPSRLLSKPLLAGVEEDEEDELQLQILKELAVFSRKSEEVGLSEYTGMKRSTLLSLVDSTLEVSEEEFQSAIQVLVTSKLVSSATFDNDGEFFAITRKGKRYYGSLA